VVEPNLAARKSRRGTPQSRRKKRKEKKRKEKKRKEKTTPFGVNLMRSQVLYLAAQQQQKECMPKQT